ncbi:MAG: cytochrome P450 [Actinobacteria bacterium]|jgi:cytochrome P450|nr:cytochrome P450 [Actinomycetota bacterium]
MSHTKPLVEDFATDFDHADPQWVNNPYPIWEDLRTRCPVAHTDRYGGAWFPATHELVSRVAKDTENFTSRSVVMSNLRPTDEDLPAPIGIAPPITSDPPFHAIARRLVLPAFSPGVVNALEPQIRALCNSLLDDMGDAAVVNGGTQFAQYIPVGVIQQMLGFPLEDIEMFLQIVIDVLDSIDSTAEDRQATGDKNRAYFEKQIQDHIDNPRDDFTTYLLNAEIAGTKLELDHVIGTILLTLVAGIDTTWSAISSSLWHLAQNPDDLARLVNEPELIDVAVEEFLRFYAPVTMARLVAKDHDFNGCPMKKDDWVLLGFPAANRDPEVFEDADKFIIDRRENRHVAFGLGIHRCAGSNLARLELKVAIQEFIKRYPTFTLENPSEVTFSPGQVRGARNLPIRVK